MRARKRPIPGASIESTRDETEVDPASGAVTSRQSAEIVLPRAELERLWTPATLERLARTYWVSISRFTLGLVRVDYSEGGRAVVFLAAPLRLLTFKAPEFEVAADRGRVRWRIDRGLLVTRESRGGDGYLELEVEREDELGGERTRLRVAVEVASYYPALNRLSRWLYVNVQARIHVAACNFFLRRLVRRELEPSRQPSRPPR